MEALLQWTRTKDWGVFAIEELQMSEELINEIYMITLCKTISVFGEESLSKLNPLDRNHYQN